MVKKSLERALFRERVEKRLMAINYVDRSGIEVLHVQNRWPYTSTKYQ